MLYQYSAFCIRIKKVCWVLKICMENNGLHTGITDVSDVAINSVSSPVNHASSASDSIFDMFWRSGFIVKFVILTLFCASIWSWTIIISKYFKMKRLNAEADEFEENFWSGTDLESLYKEIRDSAFDPFSNVFCAAMAEWERVIRSGKTLASSLEQKIDRIMHITINKEIEDLERHNTFLSTLGTNGVIIGILGMVVSIMEGMKTIAINQTVGMAAVAPILSESLFTTALGLFAAIPAAIAYNKLSSDINKYVNRLETFADEFSSIVSRQIEDA